MDIGLGSTAVELLTSVAGVPGSISGPGSHCMFHCIHMLIVPPFRYKTLTGKSYYNLKSKKKMGIIFYKSLAPFNIFFSIFGLYALYYLKVFHQGYISHSPCFKKYISSREVVVFTVI